MVIGPPYISASDIRVIPLAKRILNRRGKVIAVISSELNLDSVEKLWQGDNQHQTSLQVTQDETYSQIINVSLNKQPVTSKKHPTHAYIYEKYHLQVANQEKNAHVISSNKAANHNLLFYHAIFDKPFTATADATSQRQQILDELRFSGVPHQVMIGAEQYEKSLYTLAFNKKYNLWFSVGTSYAELKNSLNKAVSYYFIYYFILMAIILSLFFWIANIEKEKLQEITYKAQHDTLTGLYNRSELKAQFKSAILQNNTRLALLYLDLGNFKNINDSFGYSYGDLILKEVSKRIVNSLKHLPGTAFRHHGDEFVILIRSGDQGLVEKYAARLLQFIAFPYVIHNNQFQINSAIGIASYPNHAVFSG